MAATTPETTEAATGTGAPPAASPSPGEPALDPAEEESDVGPLFGSSDGGVVRGISAEASRVLRKPLFWVGLGLFVINIKMVKPPWFPLFLLVNSVSAAERTIVTLVCILFAYLLLPFFAVICVLNGAEFVRACGSTTAYVAHGFAPECTPACGRVAL